MFSSLDKLGHVRLNEVRYSNSNLEIVIDGVCDDRGVPSITILKFRNVFHFIVIEEALNSLFEINDVPGRFVLNEWRCGEHEISSALKMGFFPFYESSKHFEVVTVDEVVHIFCNEAPSFASRDKMQSS